MLVATCILYVILKYSKIAIDSHSCALFHQPMPADSLSVDKHDLHASTAQLLPPEIWAHILSSLPSSALQHTAVSLSRAIPAAKGVSDITQLFRHLVISRDNQAKQLVIRLRRLGDQDGIKAKQAAISLTGLAWR